MNFYEQDSITYAVDDDGIVYFIVDRKVKRRIIAEDDWKYNRWEQYNLNQAYKGGKTIECYEEFLVDILDCVLTVEEAIILEEHKKQQGHAKYIKSKNEIDTLIRDNLGGFYFSIYKDLLDINLEPQYEFRFVYLCTYMNYDNKITFGNAEGNGKLAHEKDLMEIWKLGREELRKTKNALVKANLITIEEDKTISINKKYAVKGKITKKILRGSVRIMENGLRNLYENVTPKEHKKVDVLIKLLPYVNYDYNILCKNPSESNKDKIEPLTIKDLCGIVGYDVKNQTKLKNSLLKLKVKNKCVIAITLVGNKHAISVNPYIYYKGNKMNNLKHLCAIFDILDK